MNAMWIMVPVLLGGLGSLVSDDDTRKSPASRPDNQVTIASVLDMHLRAVEQTVIETAEAMPEDKYSFAPTNGAFKGVRTFAEELRHIATANNSYFGSILGEKFDLHVAQGNGPDSIRTKAQILQYLRDSYALGHRAIASITAENATLPLPNVSEPFVGTRLALANISLWHAFDHYGQMVEYVRMNGIVPPLSRK